MNCSRSIFISASFISAAALALATAQPAAAAAPSPAGFTTVTASDQTASASIPAGWKLASGANGFLHITGPDDEQLSLGTIVLAKNASGGALGPGVIFALPYSASIKDKFSAIVRAGAAKQGVEAPEISIASAAPTKLAACARLLGGFTSSGDSSKFESILCSLPPDYLGFYKNIVFMARVPSSRAAEDRPVVEQIAQSYRVTTTMFKKMISPYTPAPPRPPAGTMPVGGMPGMGPSTDMTDCFDYNVIRESPPWEVPAHCAGLMPG